ncbi:2b39dff3-ee1e-4787-827f-2a7d9516924a [Thermothielavioides terrestris]|nr:2b39dff3-ee1e-4787-827f-2a7d9516924a [Thermothielavioides terrestris]
MAGFDGIDVPIYCFLISHGDRHVLFDLGVRKDWHHYAPKTVDLIRRTTRCRTDKNVSEILDEHAALTGVRSADIEAIIWSHHHFDHIGDPSTFPASTDLVVGPGVKAACWPAYPTNPHSLILDADAAGRTVREVDFGAAPLRIGRFDAVDYFGDGSFYLLDAPGHSVGHLTALARVTAAGDGGDDASFVFMGADACHHPGVLRPTKYLPLPAQVSLSQPPPRICCPGEALQRIHRSGDPAEPFFHVSTVLFPDHEAAMDTVEKITELDANDNVFVILAHDESLRGHIDLFPQAINDWKARGLRPRTRWLFCKDFAAALDISKSLRD